MCGRVIVDYDENLGVAEGGALSEWMVGRPDGYAPSWDLKPTQPIPVAFTDRRDGSRRFEYAHWSLVPPWSKELRSRFPTFNARAETAAEKPSFRPSLQSRRCVVPVSGFYEWTGPKSARVPHAIFGPEPVLPLAGLYTWWHEPGAADDAGWHLTATILTRSSAGVMEPLHDRMPVFLGEELLRDWLDPQTLGDQLLVNAVAESSLPISERLREYAVRPLRGDGPELIEPA
ncbi:SOS response-associated peptidase [Leucobacter massiliensis]|uniref:Abasic site processing protein n=1 Tax=Leucobacter massiliensis TaxID=1686285 RepID=A0A2S9QM31_9MICO|nr:SOS response-associated peptidase [Leucobacter massiliensis]PRI10646.1 hypothetical protein B4915_06990 [Leucobacter massiliensis]